MKIKILNSQRRSLVPADVYGCIERHVSNLKNGSGIVAIFNIPGRSVLRRVLYDHEYDFVG